MDECLIHRNSTNVDRIIKSFRLCSLRLRLRASSFSHLLLLIVNIFRCGRTCLPHYALHTKNAQQGCVVITKDIRYIPSSLTTYSDIARCCSYLVVIRAAGLERIGNNASRSVCVVLFFTIFVISDY